MPPEQVEQSIEEAVDWFAAWLHRIKGLCEARRGIQRPRSISKRSFKAFRSA